MGYYINHTQDGRELPSHGKADALIADGAIEITGEITFQDDLICVVDNGMFDAAGYAFNEREFEVFQEPDGRKRRWLMHPKAAYLARYKKQ